MLKKRCSIFFSSKRFFILQTAYSAYFLPLHSLHLFCLIALFIGNTGGRPTLYCQVPCPSSVCLVLNIRMHIAYELYARCLRDICMRTGELERAFTLYFR